MSQKRRNVIKNEKIKKKKIKRYKTKQNAIFQHIHNGILGVFVFAGIHAYMDGMDKSADKYYKDNNFQDIWLSGENFSNEDLEKVKNTENVKDAERLLTINTELENKEDVTLETNFIESNNISKMYVVEGEEFSKDKKGVWFDSYLAKNLDLKVEDEITWHIFGDDNWYTCKIVGLNRNPQNQQLNMSRKYFESLGLTYKADVVYTDEDLSNIKTIDGVDTIQSLTTLKQGMESMLETVQKMIVLLIVVSAILGFVIIYNLGILSFTEKQYQFATLKVLGFKDKQIRKIFIKQNNIISVIAIILGLPAGFYLTDWLFKTAIKDSYDFGAHINIETYIFAAIGTFVISYIVSKLLAKKVKKIDMVTSLKGNE